MEEKNKLKTSKKERESFKETLKNLDKFAQQIVNLNEQQAELCELKVNDIINSNNIDNKTIERTLDRLLDIVYTKKGLKLFNKLCKYYSSINLAAANNYFNYCKEILEEE